MKPKTKIVFTLPLIGWRNHRARVLAKKSSKEGNEERYPLQWKNDYVLKKAKKFLKTMNVKLEVEGFDNIPKGTSLIVANHSSALDGTIMLAALKNPSFESDKTNPLSVFLAKKELEKDKRFRGYFQLKNTFYVDRNNPRQALKTINDMSSFAKRNSTHMIVFPEGTRSKDGKLGEFKPGAFRVAKKSFVPIVPVTIDNALSATDITKKNKLVVKVIFHKAIKPMKFITSDNAGIAKKVKKIINSSLSEPLKPNSTSFEKRV